MYFLFPSCWVKIAKYHYFLKLLVFYHCLRNIQHYITFLKLEFKKIEQHKNTTQNLITWKSSSVQCVTQVEDTRVPCKNHFPLPTALIQSTIALTQPQFLTPVALTQSTIALTQLQLLTLIARLSISFNFLFFQLLSNFFFLIGFQFCFLLFQVWVSLFSFFCQGHVTWDGR